MQDNKLLKDSIPNLIKSIAIPSATGLFFNTLYNIVDNFYAGLIDTEAVAAVSISGTIFFLLTTFGMSFGYGISALLGNALGQKKQFLAGLYAKKAIVFIIIIACCTTLLSLVLAPYGLKLLGAEGEYFKKALSYINVIILGTLFFNLNSVLNSILVAKGDSKSYRNALIFGFFLNLILNPLFIYGFAFIPAMGIAGLAISTVLIQAINNIYMLKKVLATGLVDFKSLQAFSVDWRIYKAFITQGMPSVLNFTAMSLGGFIIVYFVSNYGFKAVAGYGLGLRIEQLFLLLAIGLSPAVLSIVSNNFGAKQYDRVLKCIKVSLKYAAFISLAGIVIIFFAGELMLGLFDKDKAVVAYGFSYIMIESFTFFAYTLNFIAVATLQGIKKPFIIPYVGLYRQILAPLIVYYLVVMVFELELMYLWLSLFAITTSAGIFIIFYALKEVKTIIAADAKLSVEA